MSPGGAGEEQVIVKQAGRGLDAGGGDRELSGSLSVRTGSVGSHLVSEGCRACIAERQLDAKINKNK
jgi:hypothetical protein